MNRLTTALMLALVFASAAIGAPAPAFATPSIAVLTISSDGLDPLWNQSFDPGKAFGDLLTNKLVDIGKLSVVDREHIENVFTEQKYAQSGDFAQANAVKLGHMLGANYLVVGRIVHLDKVRENKALVGAILSQTPLNIGGAGVSGETVKATIALRVLDANSGRIVKAFTYERTKTGTSFILGDVSNGVGGYSSQQFTSSSVGQLLIDAANELGEKISGANVTASGPSIRAKIIAADSGSFILNKGSADGVSEGMYFNVMHSVAARDPDTGNTIVTDITDGEVEVVSVSEHSCVARRVSGNVRVGSSATSI